ncbi:MAG: hypothetical protein ABH828_04715 [archaeon]
MKPVTKYIIASAIKLYSAIATGCCPYDSDEPAQLFTGDPNIRVWAYSGNFRQRRFIDEKPFGSLDEVVIVKRGGTIVDKILPGDETFEEQEEVFKYTILNRPE